MTQLTPGNAPHPPDTPQAPPPRWRAALRRLRERFDLRIAAGLIGLLLAGLWLDTRNRINTLQQELVRELAEAGAFSQ